MNSTPRTMSMNSTPRSNIFATSGVMARPAGLPCGALGAARAEPRAKVAEQCVRVRRVAEARGAHLGVDVTRGEQAQRSGAQAVGRERCADSTDEVG